jgi:hypothetical protein
MSKFGCIKDRFDGRDYLMRPYLPAAKAPTKIDYTTQMSPVRDQGDEGTCVAFATGCGVKEYQERIDYSKLVPMSPRFLYSICKKLDGLPDEEGTTIRVAMKALKKYGTCRERFWPYRPHQKDKPRPGAAKDAARFKERSYARILNLNELKLSISSKGPCVAGVEVFKGMMKTRTGVVPMPKRGERPLGGHAICLVGYDDRRGFVKFKNSWGRSWGDKGYGWFSYEYIEKFMMDAWSSIDIDDPNPLTLASVLEYTTRVA